MTLELVSPAKLNLFLLITGRRADGYHNLQTLFQLLDYGDPMQFTPRKDEQIRLVKPIPGIPNEHNLILRAARALAALAKPPFGMDICVEKKLPQGGGVGGGSSNAATTLLALNHLWQLGLSVEQLCQIGLKLGADVPIFTRGQSAYAEGVGELITPTQIAPRWYLVVDSGIAVSTSKIFSHPHLTRDSTPIKIPPLAADCVRNDCLPVVEELYPQIGEARRWLEQFGAVRLTGTGGCIFSDFNSADDAQAVLERLPHPWQGFVAQGVDTSPVLNQVKNTTGV